MLSADSIGAHLRVRGGTGQFSESASEFSEHPPEAFLAAQRLRWLQSLIFSRVTFIKLILSPNLEYKHLTAKAQDAA
jgi:hypothetical protein